MNSDKPSLQSWELQPIREDDSHLPDSELLSPPLPSSNTHLESSCHPQEKQPSKTESYTKAQPITELQTEHISKHPTRDHTTTHQTATTPPLNTNSLIATAAAIALLTTGICIGWSYYTKGESTRTYESALLDTIAALDDDTKVTAAKLIFGREKVEALLPWAEACGLLQKSIVSKQEQIRLTQQLNAPMIEKMQNLQNTISALEEKLNSSPPSSPPPKPTPPIVDNRDQKTVQQSLDYLKARETGNIGTLSQIFGEQCSYQYAHGNTTANSFIMDDIKKFWDKWPHRTYKLLRVAHADNNVELIYQYQCSNPAGKTIRGFTKETWQLSPEGRITSWSEKLDRTTPPAPSPHYKVLKVEY